MNVRRTTVYLLILLAVLVALSCGFMTALMGL